MKCLAEKQQMFAAACEKALKQESHHQGLLLRGDASDLQQGETLLLAAIHQGGSPGAGLSRGKEKHSNGQCIHSRGLYFYSFIFFFQLKTCETW